MQEVNAFLVPCLGEPVQPPVAARLHRVEALGAFAAADKKKAFAAMRAARAVDPGVTIADALLPPGHELRLAYERGPTADGGGTALPLPRAGTLWFDGTDTAVRPDGRPTLAQLAGKDGVVTTSAWLGADDPMFAYPTRPRVRTALAITAGVATAVAGAFLGGGQGARAAYGATAPGDLDQLATLRGATNGLSGAGLALGGVALGTGLAAAFVGDR